MKTSKMILCCISVFLFFNFSSFGDGVLHAAKVENQRWSFDFKSCTVSDVLRQMAEVTGIDIFTNQTIDKGLFSKFYKEQTIDQILRDLFRKENCAMVWSYSDNGLDAIGVWIFEGSGSGDNFSPKKFLKERRTSMRGNKIVRSVDHESRVVSRKLQEADKNKDAEESISSQYWKPASDSLEYSASNRKVSLAIPAFPSPIQAGANAESSITDGGIAQNEDYASETTPPQPMPENLHGLEPPPMPPGFSN